MVLKKRQGFTLIEIIVVLVITGILAAIALPNIFSWIQKSRAAEGLASMGTIKEELTPCLAAHASNLVACGFPQGCAYPLNTSQAIGGCSSTSGFGSSSGLGEGEAYGGSGNLSGNFYYLVIPACLNVNAINSATTTSINAELDSSAITGIFAAYPCNNSGSYPWTIIATYKDQSGSLLLSSPDVSVAATCAGLGTFQGVC